LVKSEQIAFGAGLSSSDPIAGYPRVPIPNHGGMVLQAKIGTLYIRRKK